MATSRIPALLLVLAAAPAWSREAASTSECQAAAAKPAISVALAKAVREPDDLRAQFALADAWSDSGCFNDAVTVLQNALKLHPENAELQTRFRVAKSLVGEEHFFDDLDRADMQARLKRAIFRCENLSDPDACAEALRVEPDDPGLLAALEKLHAADARSPAGPGSPGKTATRSSAVRMARTAPKSTAPKLYSNSAPPGQTH